MNDVEIIHSECSDFLETLEENSLDACITDPPYELGFMDKEWDRSGIAFDPEFWKKVKRVLKPGAYMAVFGGSRTFHRIAVGIEDAGFEIRDTIDWIYGSGFPKNHDVSKAIDKKLGKLEERKMKGLKDNAKREDGSMVQRDSYENWIDNPSNWQERGRDPYEWEPGSEKAKEYENYGTALKPAKEPIIIARKPLDGTVAENILKYGTGAINIDDCRTPVDPDDENIRENYEDHERETGSIWDEADGAPKDFTGEEGRYPANIILDKWAADQIDKQSGEYYSGSADHGTVTGKESFWRSGKGDVEWKKKDRSAYGGASRYFKQIEYHPVDSISFFYCPKVSKKERNIAGENNHVTVKPVELMTYLIRLLTPEGGEIIDPFAGSGTTGMAAILEGFDSILVEMKSDYVDICERRVNYIKENYREVYDMIYDDPSNSLTKEADMEKKKIDHNFWE